MNTKNRKNKSKENSSKIISYTRSHYYPTSSEIEFRLRALVNNGIKR